MLRDVMWMDYVQNRRALLLNAGLFLVFALLLVNGEGVPALEFTGLSCLMFSLAPMTIVVREDKFKTKSFVCSLPATRASIILGRYVLGIVLGILGGAICLLLVLLLPSSTMDVTAISPVRTLLVGAAMAVIPLSLVLPFTIRFGLIGMMVLLVGSQILGMLVLLVSRLLGFDGLRSVIAGVGSFLSRARTSLGEMGFAVAVLVLLALLATVSCRISIAIYKRREA